MATARTSTCSQCSVLTPCAAKDSWLTNWILDTCTAMKAMSSITLRNLRIWPAYYLTHAFTHPLEVHPLAIAISCHPHTETLRQSSFEIVHDVSKSHISPSHITAMQASPCQRVTTSAHIIIDFADLDQPDPNFSDLTHGPLWVLNFWLWLICWLFDEKLEFPKWPILLRFLCRFWFWTPFHHLKLKIWSIGTFFIVVSS